MQQDHERCFAGQVSTKYPEGYYWRANAPLIREFINELREHDEMEGDRPGLCQYLHRDPNDGWIWSGPYKSQEATRRILEHFGELYMEFMQECHPDIVREMAGQSDIEEGWNRIN
jgi:hypothetical protein